MEKENIAKQTKKRILEMIETRTKELTENEIKISKAKDEASAADAELTDAIKNANEKDFESAKAKKAHADLIIDMLSKRNSFIASQDFIAESESDQVIDSLLNYENELSNEFINDISVLVNKLNALLIDYRSDILEAEQTISAWTSQIHANYRRLSSPFKERTKEAQPVRVTQFYGNEESRILSSFLESRPIIKLIK